MIRDLTGTAKVVPVAKLGGARVNAHAHLKVSDFRPILGAKGALGINGGFKRIARRLKGRVDRVSNRLENEAGMVLDGRTDQRVVTGERLTHLIGKFFP